MLNRTPRYLFALIQAIIGLDWLATGINKFMFGKFPQALGTTLLTGGGISPPIAHNPNWLFAAFVQAVILPNSVFFGYLIESGEIIIGVLYLVSTFLLLGWPLREGKLSHRVVVVQLVITALASVAGVFMGFSFLFWRGKSFALLDLSRPFLPIWDANILLPLFMLCIFAVSVCLWREVRHASSERVANRQAQISI